MEKNPLLKEGILSVLNQLCYLDKINRIDAPQANASRSHSDSFLKIRIQVADAMNNLPSDLGSLYDEAERNKDIVTMQNIYSDITIKTYENWKKTMPNNINKRVCQCTVVRHVVYFMDC